MTPFLKCKSCGSDVTGFNFCENCGAKVNKDFIESLTNKPRRTKGVYLQQIQARKRDLPKVVWDRKRYIAGALTGDPGILYKLVTDRKTWKVALLAHGYILGISALYLGLYRVFAGTNPLNDRMIRILVGFLIGHELTIPIFSYVLFKERETLDSLEDFFRLATFLTFPSIIFVISVMTSVFVNTGFLNFFSYMYFLFIRGKVLKNYGDRRMFDVITILSIFFIIEFFSILVAIG